MGNKGTMIDTACQVGRSLRALRATRPGIVVARAGESREEAENNSRLDFGVTSIFLYALIVELTIKGLWSYENGGAEAEYTHHIEKRFRELQSGTRAQIEAIYESNREHYTQIVSEGKHQLGEARIQVEMASIEEALQWNAKAMVHLKYDLIPRGKTVPAGAMWDGETIWFGSEMDMPNFGLQLVDWAAKNTPSQGRWVKLETKHHEQAA